MTEASPSLPTDPELISCTVSVLIKGLRALGKAGYPDAASRLAAEAWLPLRDTHPREAERLNGTLHYLAKLPEADAPPPPTKETT